MPVKVVDASAIGALLFGEPEGREIASRLRESDLVAPTLLPFEVASICVKKLKRHVELHDKLLGALRLLPRLSIRRLDVDIQDVTRLAERSRLCAYDASYLWLAKSLNAELVTLDRALDLVARSEPPSWI
ncbi:MAG: type II toxin-antitoxin system VapC family toxin [Gammaproteobacteria bacterium]